LCSQNPSGNAVRIRSTLPESFQIHTQLEHIAESAGNSIVYQNPRATPSCVKTPYSRNLVTRIYSIYGESRRWLINNRSVLLESIPYVGRESLHQLGREIRDRLCSSLPESTPYTTLYTGSLSVRIGSIYGESRCQIRLHIRRVLLLESTPYTKSLATRIDSIYGESRRQNLLHI
jgi:hypothetical protein